MLSELSTTSTPANLEHLTPDLFLAPFNVTMVSAAVLLKEGCPTSTAPLLPPLPQLPSFVHLPNAPFCTVSTACIPSDLLISGSVNPLFPDDVSSIALHGPGYSTPLISADSPPNLSLSDSLTSLPDILFTDWRGRLSSSSPLLSSPATILPPVPFPRVGIGTSTSPSALLSPSIGRSSCKAPLRPSFLDSSLKLNTMLAESSLTTPPLHYFPASEEFFLMKRNSRSGTVTPLSSVYRHRGGAGSPPRPRRSTTVTPTSIPSSTTYPRPSNIISLPIAQINQQRLAVADSTLPGAGQGLFTLSSVDTEEVLCKYSGTHISPSLLPLPSLHPRFDYVWANKDNSIIIDAYDLNSCYGRYANDALYEHLCNAVIEERDGDVYLVSTRPLLENEEIFVHYGEGYWADRFHLFSSSSSVRSDFQINLINSYKLRPLPSGKAITKTEAFSRTHRPTISIDLTDDAPPVALSRYMLDVLGDTYGSSASRSLALSLAFPHNDPSRNMHLINLLNLIIPLPTASAVQALRSYLTDNPSLELHFWKKDAANIPEYYSACTPNGTCGYQFLYQLYLRHQRRSMGGPPDDFPQVASRQHIDSFKEYIRSLIIPLDTPPISPGKLAAANKLRYFLTWLSSSRRPLFTENNWLDTVSMEYIILSTPSHFTYMAADANRSTPSIPGSWTYYQWDSSLPRMRDFSLTYSQLEAVILRDNFGSFTPHHFFPLPSSPDPRRDLDSALCSLVKNLIANFTAASPPRNLATYYRRGDNGICVPAPRAYHPHAPLSEDASPSPPIPTVSFSSCLGDSSVSTSPSVSSSSPELAESTLSSTDPFITDFLSPSSVDVSLDQWVSDYTRIQVPGDGDCFFSAVNFIMRRMDGNWTHDNSSLRQLSLTQLEQDVSAFYLPCIPMPGINSNLPQIWSSTKAKYQYSGQYADHDLMMATVKALNIDIQIHGGATSLLRVDGRTPSLTIHLLYSGLQADKNGGNHYDPLLPKALKIITPPIQSPSLTSSSSSVRASPWSIVPISPLSLARNLDHLKYLILHFLSPLPFRPITHLTPSSLSSPPLSSSRHMFLPLLICRLSTLRL